MLMTIFVRLRKWLNSRLYATLSLESVDDIESFRNPKERQQSVDVAYRSLGWRFGGQGCSFGVEFPSLCENLLRPTRVEIFHYL